MILVQLHWQNRANMRQTELVAQGAVEPEALHEWARDLISRRGGEMPDGWWPMICTEDAPEFVYAAKEK